MNKQNKALIRAQMAFLEARRTQAKAAIISIQKDDQYRKSKLLILQNRIILYNQRISELQPNLGAFLNGGLNYEKK